MGRRSVQSFRRQGPVRHRIKAWRFYLVRAALLLVAGVIFLRLVQIQIFTSAMYVKKGRQQYMERYVLKANRGLIYDRNL
ncbi:MAG TPA: hypothetical protein VGA99_13520, partial [bacterium]